jgi:hypothetical protein
MMLLTATDGRWIFDVIGSVASAVAVWAQAHAARVTTPDPVDDLIEQVRHPVRWSFKHPLRALGRQVPGRFN